MQETSFYSKKELLQLGFKSIGTRNLQISRFARFYGIDKMTIGNNVRIDDFAILSGNITLGNHVHIGAYSALYGKFGIEMEDFTGISPRTTVFSATDDFSGDYLISPMVPEKYTNVTGGKVIIQKFSQIGAGTIIMPSLTIEEGVTVGAMSFIRKNLIAWHIYAGIPAKKIKPRQKKCIELANFFISSDNNA
ncbi:acyltransferase [Marinilabilia salmonicolor]|uniref:acyltransferase n=1 Tax=Marinilabilia salmonicolor TaxID=989 RepID=UPI00029A6880|nr:galactoside O-acetyltransferase [Marinilabilia salmonicolor]